MHGSRFRRAPALGVLAAALLAPTAAVASVNPPTVSLDGTYTLVHVDGTAGHPGADAYRQELLAGGRAYDVVLGAGTSFRSGDTVRLSGTLVGSTLHVRHSSVSAFAPDVAPVGGTTRVLVVLAQWTAPDSTTQAGVADVFAADNTWFNQTSYGHLSLSTTVTNWVHVSPPAAGLCSDSSVSDQLANRATTAAGYNAASFDRVVVYFPRSSDPSCGNVAGFAEAPGHRVWLNGVMDARSSIHEQGHNYGLYHAHSASCVTPGSTVPAAGPDSAADNCTYSDYGDPFDAMGASNLVAEYSAGQKNVLGWLDSGRKVTLTAGSTVALVPYEAQTAGSHAAVYVAGSTRSYWFENRVAQGPDAALPSGATDGLLVHVVDTAVDAVSGEASYWAPAQSYLLDQTPADRWVGASVLPYGQSWTSPEGVTFTAGTPAGGAVALTAALLSGGPPPAAPGTSPPAPSAQAAQLTLGLADGQPSGPVAEGGTVLLTGSATRANGAGAAGATVQLQTTAHGQGAWRTLETSTVSDAGFVSAAVRALASADYRWHLVPSATELGSDSNLLSLPVKPVVIAAVTRPTIRHGSTVGLNVSVPGHAGQVVLVQRWARNAWHPYTAVRLGKNGKRSVPVRLATKGHYLYRFVKAADTDHVSSPSKTLRIRAL